MDKEEAVKIFDLVVKQGGLPQTLDKLVPMSFIGSAAVKFYQAKVKLMNQLGVTEEQRKATLADGQDAGEMLLNIEARIGELLPDEKEASRIGVVRGGKIRQGKKPSSPSALGELNSDRARAARSIHRNPAAVRDVIAEAKKNEDIPTKTAVLNKIRLDRETKLRKEYEAKIKEQKGDSATAAKGDAMIYLGKLREVVLILPAKVPAEGWTDRSFAEAQAMVEIIRKRLEVWV